MLAGITAGLIEPSLARTTKPLLDIFISIIKVLIGPIVFFTVLNGILGMGNLKSLGSIGLKAFIYFELMSTIALIIGLLSGYLFKTGAQLNLSVAAINPALISQYLNHAENNTSFLKILQSTIPTHPVDAFINGNTLQILFMAVITGFILFYTTKPWQVSLMNKLHIIQNVLFKILSYIMWLSPLAAFAAMAFMVGQFGSGVILHMLGLVLTMLITCIFFIIVVLGIVGKLFGFNIFRLISYIKDEIILVFATSSSESALAPIMNKLKLSGVDQAVVGIVIPAGYSFNLDGTNIYLALVIAFLCQAFNIQLTFSEHLTIIAVLMLTSKGAAGVTGSGFIILAGTLAALNGKIPVETIAILLGVDKIMSELRATTNLVGNTVATIIVAILNKKLDWNKFNQTINGSSNTSTNMVK
jgi:aerobic C4-dicarboxylate transport protein